MLLFGKKKKEQNSILLKTDVIASIHLLSKDESDFAIQFGIFTQWRANIFFNDTDIRSTFILPNGTDLVFPGTDAEVKIIYNHIPN